MHEQSVQFRAERSTTEQDDAPELKRGLARLALSSAPTGLHAAARLRNYFLTGVVIAGPATITLYAAWHVINVIDAWMKPIIPSAYDPESYLPFAVPGVGLVIAVVLLTLIGAVAANLFGRSLISAGELMVARMPIVRNVYRGLREIFASVLKTTGTSKSLQRVALVQFPSKGIWSLGFVTGEAANEIRNHVSGESLISVFIAHGLLPPSGITCFVRQGDVKPIKMSVEDAAKIILSAGMADPERRSR